MQAYVLPLALCEAPSLLLRQPHGNQGGLMEDEYAWARKPEPPPTFKDKLKRLLWSVYGILFYILLAMTAYGVLRNFMHGVSILD